jgi:ssDNA-specific exonuclease RecJ
MSNINLILLIAVFGICAALPVPSDEVVSAEVVNAEVPFEAEVVNDETKKDDPSRIFSKFELSNCHFLAEKWNSQIF